MAVPEAAAQTAANFDRWLLQPTIDGDPRNPPRFRRPTPGVLNDGGFRPFDGSRAQSQSGAGSTGFDSRNAPRRRLKNAQKPNDAGGVAMAQPQTPPNGPRQNRVQRPALAIAYSTGAVAGTPTTIPLALQRRKLAQDEDPFVPIGVQIGAFTMRPAVEVTGAYDSNPPRSPSPKASWFSLFSPEFLVNSNWARHEVTANLRGSLTSYEETKNLNRPEFDSRINGRVDVTGKTRVDLEARYLVGTDNPGSPNIQANLVRLPVFTTLGGTAGIAQRFNRLDLTAKFGVDRTLYGDSTFSDGSVSSNAGRDYIRYNAALRFGYELTPGLKPFAEVAVDSRVYDLPADANGVSRDSKGISGKAGTTFEFSRILTGEASAGYLARDYRDPTLSGFGGLLLDGSLVWLMSALTTVKLTAATTVTESTVPGVSGAFTRTVGAQVDHAFRRWLVATGKFTLGIDDYVGSPRHDMRYMASAQLTYKLSRELWLRTEYRHLWNNSSVPVGNYTADVFLLGARLQR